MSPNAQGKIDFREGKTLSNAIRSEEFYPRMRQLSHLGPTGIIRAAFALQGNVSRPKVPFTVVDGNNILIARLSDEVNAIQSQQNL
jgi:hypothetical protein